MKVVILDEDEASLQNVKLPHDYIEVVQSRQKDFEIPAGHSRTGLKARSLLKVSKLEIICLVVLELVAAFCSCVSGCFLEKKREKNSKKKKKLDSVAFAFAFLFVVLPLEVPCPYQVPCAHCLSRCFTTVLALVVAF